MDKQYYETVDKLEKMGVDREYIQGWIAGYLDNPKREEQRLNETYNAGYEDGQSKQMTNAEKFKA